MILTPQRRSKLVQELSLLTPSSFLLIVETCAGNIATMVNTFEQNGEDVQMNQLYHYVQKLRKELEQ